MTDSSTLSRPRRLLVGVQHLFVMFGATVLVPLLTGLDVGVALFASGVGTLIFHVATRFRVPVYLGSSFAFIPPILAGAEAGTLAEATGAIATIPLPVIGGISILLFGLISAIGIRSLVEHRVDLGDPRFLVLVSTMLVLGLGGAPDARARRGSGAGVGRARGDCRERRAADRKR